MLPVHDRAVCYKCLWLVAALKAMVVKHAAAAQDGSLAALVMPSFHVARCVHVTSN
jgi:hypothetical protein